MTKGDNFMGEIFRVLCQDTTNSNNQTSLILKKAPRNLMLRQAFHSRDLFLREIAMYDQVSDHLKHKSFFDFDP